MAPESVSGSGSVMNSMPKLAMIGQALRAVATVTNPAPARSAAFAASAAAPVLPIDRRLDALGNVRWVRRGAGELRAGRKPDLVVDDEMDRAARAVARQAGEAE